MTQEPTRRAGFTLVEMLVASALIIFMMYVIASAFESGLASFRIMKAQGDMQEKLRATASAIRLDLSTPHFGGAMSPSNQGPFLVNQRLNDQYWQPPQKGYFRICMPGDISGTWVQEGIDPDNPSLAYYRPTKPLAYKDMYLQFTVNLTDGHPQVRDGRGRQDQFYMTDTTDPTQAFQDGTLNQYSTPNYNVLPPSPPPTLFTSQWAEVAYFLKPQSPARYADAAQSVPLFDLYRRQILLVEPVPGRPYPVAVPMDAGRTRGNYANVSNYPSGSGTIFNGAADVTEPFRRWGMTRGSQFPYGQPTATNLGTNPPTIPPFSTTSYEAGPPNSPYAGNPTANPILGPQVGGDLLLTDIVNFDMKVLWEPVRLGAPDTDRFVAPTVKNGVVATPDYVEPSPSANPNDPTRPSNPDYPFDYLPFGINPGFLQNNASAGISPVRVFDTWSSNRDVTVNPQNPSQVISDYNYGPPASAGAMPGRGSQSTMLQQELGAWNVGHFARVPGLSPPTLFPTQYSIPLRIRVRAIQIKLRIWDQKSNQTRQMTIIQDL
ncbi:MAG TPA: prepilin-type N-terminal cleavage/methylation domain-containing protein [Gemmataceae bacterium]|nr:prepilin-type N-terminal cleavage/methylation domain-containing protein [Gemmataceae bacterium]